MRSLSFETHKERRRQVVGLRRLGWTYEAIAQQTGLSRTGVFNICQRYAREGVRGLKDKRGGRKVGDYRALSADLEAAVSSQAPARTKGELKKATRHHLRRLQKSPRRVMSYFQHRPVRYAA